MILLKKKGRKKALYSFSLLLLSLTLVFSTVSPVIAAADDANPSAPEANVSTPDLSISGLDEQQIRNGSPTAKLELALTNAKWADLDTNAQKRQVLIDSLVAKDQKDQWELIKQTLTPDQVVPDAGKEKVTINIPKTASLLLANDQTISIKLPYQLLENDVQLTERSFKITAQPKALLSGTALTSMSQADLTKGGKTIIVTLVNAEWADDIATNTANREKLLGAFTWGAIQAEIFAKADVNRTNNSTVTIKLPPVSGKFTNDNIPFAGQLSNTLLKTNTALLDYTKSIDITAVENQSATVSGSATNKINELDISKGEKEVIVTLKNDTWSRNPTGTITLKAGTQNLAYDNLTRTNDTTVVLKLKEQPGFTVEKDTAVDVTIPNSMLSVAKGDLKVSSAFKISKTAVLSGTGLSLDTAEVQKGGKTLIVTLNSAEFKDGLSADKVKKMLTVKGTASNPLPWTELKDFTVAKNKLTIKLPAVPDYQADSTSTLELNVDSDLLKGYEAGQSIKAGEISIGASGSATLGQTSYTERAIQTGGNNLSITLTNAAWDPSIETNASKKAALLRGFAVTDQAKEWKLVTDAIVKDSTFKIEGSKLSITLPALPDYSIKRDQIVSIKIPKAVLSDYKYDMEIPSPLKITILELRDSSSFVEKLESGLAAFIEQNGLNNLRVVVPERSIKTVTTSVSELNGHTIALIEVNANNETAKTVTATLASDGGEVTKTANGPNRFSFVFDNVKNDSVLKLAVYDGSGNLIQQIFKKMSKGKKTYNELPKTPLNGRYALQALLTEQSLLNEILKYYTLDELKIGVVQ